MMMGNTDRENQHDPEQKQGDQEGGFQYPLLEDVADKGMIIQDEAGVSSDFTEKLNAAVDQYDETLKGLKER